VLQRDPVQKLPRDERLPVLVVNFVNRADVRMIECGGCLGFALETAECLRVFGYIVGQELESHEAPELQILSLVDNTHPAASQLLDDAVMGNRLPNGLRGRSHWIDMLGVGDGKVNVLGAWAYLM